MEAQTRYWMWMKKQIRDQILKNSSSWEEKAFAVDAAAAWSLGECIWPQRSYSCSFCKREFKSAQALGGHMNVHRRDRARLKNSVKLSTNPNKCPSDHSSLKNNVTVVVSSSPLSNSRVSATSSTSQENSSSSSSSSFVQAKHNVKDYVETNLSLGLKPNTCCEEAISCKRTKTSAAVSNLPNLFTSNEYFSLQNENLDLELRLGYPSKVK